MGAQPRSYIPIIADESCLHAADIPKLKDAFDGVNVKLDKAGVWPRLTK